MNDDEKVLNSVELYEVRRNIWINISQMPSSRYMNALITAGGNLFAMEGCTAIGDKNSRITNSAELFDETRGDWKYIPALREDLT